MNTKTNKKWIIIFLLPTLMLFFLIYAASVAILFGTSFTDWTLGFNIKWNGLNNYVELFKNRDFISSMKNTFVWILLQATVHVVIGVSVALILSKKPFYWKFTRTVYMIPNIISSAAMGMLFLSILNPNYGALNSIIRQLGFRDFSHNWLMNYKTSFLSVTMMWLPFAAVVTILVLAEMAAISESIFESAQVDGASEFEINVYIVLPLLRNIIGTCSILAGVSMLQRLDTILMTTGGGPGNRTMNLPMFIYNNALRDNNFGFANSAGVILVIIGIITVLTISRVFRIGESRI